MSDKDIHTLAPVKKSDSKDDDGKAEAGSGKAKEEAAASGESGGAAAAGGDTEAPAGGGGDQESDGGGGGEGKECLIQTKNLYYCVDGPHLP